MLRFTRLTNGISRTHEHHEAALGLFFMYYNFCQMHSTLKTAPAVAAKLTDKQWTVAEMIERTANYIPKQNHHSWQSLLDTLPDDD